MGFWGTPIVEVRIMLRQLRKRHREGQFRRYLKKTVLDFLYCFWLIPVIFFVSCVDLSSDEDNNEPKISEVWVIQRVDISIDARDGNHYSYSFTDKAHFDNLVYEDNYGYWSGIANVVTPFAYVLFDKGRIACLESSDDYEKFKKNPRIVNSHNSEYYMMHYKIENNKMYFNLDSYENDPDDYFAFYVLSNKKSSIVLEIRDDATATTGYYHFKVPQEAWHVTLYEDSHYCYTAYYAKEHR